MGRKTKKNIFDLGKIWGRNWGFMGFWTLFWGQEAKNVNFRGGMKELEKFSKRVNEAEMEKNTVEKFEGDWVRIREVMKNFKN